MNKMLSNSLFQRVVVDGGVRTNADKLPSHKYYFPFPPRYLY